MWIVMMERFAYVAKSTLAYKMNRLGPMPPTLKVEMRKSRERTDHSPFLEIACHYETPGAFTKSHPLKEFRTSRMDIFILTNV